MNWSATIAKGNSDEMNRHDYVTRGCYVATSSVGCLWPIVHEAHVLCSFLVLVRPHIIAGTIELAQLHNRIGPLWAIKNQQAFKFKLHELQI